METQELSAQKSGSRFSTVVSSVTTIHIIAEIIALCVVVVWFSMKNKMLIKHIEDLATRLDEHDTLLEKQDMAIRKLMALVSNKPISKPIKEEPKKRKTEPAPVQHQPDMGSLLTSTLMSGLMGGMPDIFSNVQQSDSITELPSDTDLDKEIESEINELQSE